LAFVFPDYGSGWNAENDFSNQEIIGKSGTADAEGTIKGFVTKYIPVYINGELYYGEEPDGTSADGGSQTSTEPDKPISTTTSASPTTESGKNNLVGDANEDGSVDIADATAIIQHMGNPDEYALSEQGKINADIVNQGDGVTGADAVTLQLIEAKKIRQSELPLTMEQYNALLSE
ncbi:MAG: dockerin type I repeat-containing protein, partial [Ruminococcus sp.]|nr:dockerin type I repeat-containing protein [Ruminococcus sp.]